MSDKMKVQKEKFGGLNKDKDQFLPLSWFLKTLGMVLVYLCLPVPGPFLCWTLSDHPSGLL